MTKNINTSKIAAASSSVALIQKYLFVGNYFLARKAAHNVLATSSQEQERTAAKLVLKETFPDTLALLAGCGCLAFSTTILFLAAY